MWKPVLSAANHVRIFFMPPNAGREKRLPKSSLRALAGGGKLRKRSFDGVTAKRKTAAAETQRKPGRLYSWVLGTVKQPPEIKAAQPREIRESSGFRTRSRRGWRENR